MILSSHRVVFEYDDSSIIYQVKNRVQILSFEILSTAKKRL